MTSKGWVKGAAYSKNMRINSGNRIEIPGYTDTDFKIDLGTNVQQVLRMSVVSCQFPRVFYNIISNNIKYNNKMVVILNLGPGTEGNVITIPIGWYNVYSLVDAINAQIAALFVEDFVLAAVVNPDTGIVSLSGTSTTGIVTAEFYLPTSETNRRQDMWPLGMIGWPKKLPIGDFVEVTASGGFTTAPHLPRLNQPSIVYITSSCLAQSNSIDEKGSNSNILVAINLDVQWGQLQVWKCKQDILCEIEYGLPRSFDIVDIQLVDHDLDPLDLNGNELNVELRIWMNRL